MFGFKYKKPSSGKIKIPNESYANDIKLLS